MYMILYFCVYAFLFCIFASSQERRGGGQIWAANGSVGLWGLWGWLRLVEPDEIYIRNYSRKFGRPARNIKDPGIFPSRLYTVQFESIILLNIQWNFFLNTLPTSVTLLYVKLKRGFQGNYARFLLSFKCYQWSVSCSVVFVFLVFVKVLRSLQRFIWIYLWKQQIQSPLNRLSSQIAHSLTTSIL